MEELKNKINWKIVFKIALIVVLIIGCIRIAKLTNEISNLRNQIEYLESHTDTIGSRIDSIYNNVDERLKQETSLMSSVEYEVGEINITTHKADVRFKVVPKNITDEMILSIDMGEDSAGFSREGNEFTTTLKCGIFQDYGSKPIISIQTAEGIQTEQLEDIDLGSLYHEYLPYVDADMSGTTTETNASLTIDGNVSVNYKPSSPEETITLKKIELVTELDGKEIDRKDITSKIEEYDCELPIKETYKMKGGKNLVMYVEAVDTAGYIHRTSEYSWSREDGMGRYDNGIYDKEGNLLASY